MGEIVEIANITSGCGSKKKEETVTMSAVGELYTENNELKKKLKEEKKFKETVGEIIDLGLNAKCVEFKKERDSLKKELDKVKLERDLAVDRMNDMMNRAVTGDGVEAVKEKGVQEFIEKLNKNNSMYEPLIKKIKHIDGGIIGSKSLKQNNAKLKEDNTKLVNEVEDLKEMVGKQNKLIEALSDRCGLKHDEIIKMLVKIDCNVSKISDDTSRISDIEKDISNLTELFIGKLDSIDYTKNPDKIKENTIKAFNNSVGEIIGKKPTDEEKKMICEKIHELKEENTGIQHKDIAKQLMEIGFVGFVGIGYGTAVAKVSTYVNSKKYKEMFGVKLKGGD